jgi:hypothetical protein
MSVYKSIIKSDCSCVAECLTCGVKITGKGSEVIKLAELHVEDTKCKMQCTDTTIYTISYGSTVVHGSNL